MSVSHDVRPVFGDAVHSLVLFSVKKTLKMSQALLKRVPATHVNNIFAFGYLLNFLLKKFIVIVSHCGVVELSIIFFKAATRAALSPTGNTSPIATPTSAINTGKPA